MCSEICQFKVAPKSAMFGRPVVAVSTRMCVAEYVSSSLHPTFQGYKGFADEVLLQVYTCVCCRNQGCTQGSKFYQSFASAAASIHMRVAEIRAAPRSRNVIRASL